MATKRTKLQRLTTLVRKDLGIEARASYDQYVRPGRTLELRHGYHDLGLLKRRLNDCIEQWTQQGFVLATRCLSNEHGHRLVVIFDPFRHRNSRGENILSVAVSKRGVPLRQPFGFYRKHYMVEKCPELDRIQEDALDRLYRYQRSTGDHGSF